MNTLSAPSASKLETDLGIFLTPITSMASTATSTETSQTLPGSDNRYPLSTTEPLPGRQRQRGTGVIGGGIIKEKSYSTCKYDGLLSRLTLAHEHPRTLLTTLGLIDYNYLCSRTPFRALVLVNRSVAGQK